MSSRLANVGSKDDAANVAEEQSAIDVTAGYGFDNFLSDSGFRDPWACQCFQQTVDALVNSRELSYPFPTRHSVEHGKYQGLAPSMFALQDAGLLMPAKSIIAEEDIVTEPDIFDTFQHFKNWCAANAEDLQAWIDFHRTPLYRERHKFQLLGDVHPAIRTFWKEHKSDTDRLARALPNTMSNLRYTFDVVYRGRQYMALLAGAGITYFPHPIRAEFFSWNERARYDFPVSWSWGRLFATLIREERLSANIEELIPMLANLKTRVRRSGATPARLAHIPEPEKKQIIVAIAAECGLPASIKDVICRALERAAAWIDVVLYGIPGGHFVSAHVSLALGSLALKQGVKIPGAMAKHLRFLRGFIEYPGLLERETS